VEKAAHAYSAYRVSNKLVFCGHRRIIIQIYHYYDYWLEVDRWKGSRSKNKSK